MSGSRRRRWAAAVVVAALVLGAPAVAVASPHHHTPKSGTATAAKAYWAQVAVIDRQFVAAVKLAKAALAAELAAARTAGERSTARLQYSLAIDAAVQAREQALVALGPPPATASESSRVSATLSPRVGV